MDKLQTISVSGVRVNNTTLTTIISAVEKKLEETSNEQDNRHVFPIYTINAEFVAQAQDDKTFRDILNKSYASVPDGMGILLYGFFHGNPFKEKITGIDLIHRLTKLASHRKYTIGFIGGKQGAAVKTMKMFQKKYPNLHAWADEGPNISNISTLPQTLDTYMSKKPLFATTPSHSTIRHALSTTNILFVAFGAPKQEYTIQWLSQHISPSSSPLIAVGVGGSFDEISGLTPRCPAFIEQIGLKWLFRLITEPWRWKRQTRLLEFVKLMISD